ncbi:MAG: hypothetical protein CMO01_01215 [Thalassobius sp.]|nr:hypothetical protein [Thalassovita sp.]
MKAIQFLILNVTLISISLYSFAQEIPDFYHQIPDIKPKTLLYKVTPQDSLFVDVYYPTDFKQGDKKPAIVFYFGGGWVNGTRDHFKKQSQYLASKGMISITADYRIQSIHNTTPIEAMQDARSAMRWVKQNAESLGIDLEKLAAGGGSAGGHLAAVTATLDNYDDPNDDLSISTKPKALVLFNPVIDTTPKGYGAEKMGKDKKKASPARHVKKGLPPTIIFHGTADVTVPFENVKRFEQLMIKKGNECVLIPFEGQAHGFFNYKEGNEKYFEETVKRMETFLREKGYLSK